jgi:O-antigen/teichoic acid export membrane protein
MARLAPRLVAALNMADRFAGEVRTALSNMAWKVMSMPLEKLCRFVLVAAAGQALGTAPLGRFRFATTVNLMLGLMMDLGLGIWTVRELARHRDRAAAIVWTLLRLRAMMAIAYLLSTGAAAWLVGRGQLRAAILLLGFAGVASALLDHAIAVFRGYERFVDEARVNITRALLVLLGGLAGIWVRRSVVGLTAGILAGTLAAGLYALVVLRRGYRVLGSNQRLYDPALARAALRGGFPIWLAGLVSMLYFRGDTVLLKLYSGDAVLGVYSAAYQIFEGSALLPAIVLAAAFPPLARAHLHRERQRQWELLIVSVLLICGLGVGTVFYAGGSHIIDLVFRGGFAEAAVSLRILALGVPLMFVNYGLTHFLIARDLGNRNMVFSSMMLILNMAINVVAIPRMGGPGAAWATVITEAALTVCCLVALAPQRGESEEARQPLAVSPSVSQKSP